MISHKNITLNLPYTLSKEEWDKVEKVYKELDGWMNHAEYECWYGEEDDEKSKSRGQVNVIVRLRSPRIC